MVMEDLVKEILLIVPELRGAASLVKQWANEAIRVIESAEPWNFTMAVVEQDLSATPTNPPYVMPGEIAFLPKAYVNGNELFVVSPISQFYLIGITGSKAAFAGFQNDKVYWTPPEQATSVKFVANLFTPELGDDDTCWLLTNKPSLVKNRLLATCYTYVKRLDLAEKHYGIYGLELNELRQSNGFYVPQQQQQGAK